MTQTLDRPEDIAALAKRFFASIEAGDTEAVAACYAPDVEIWHNTDGIVQSKAENLMTLKGFLDAVPDRRYVDQRLQIFEGGFVEQHRVTGTLPGGAKLDMPACIVCEVAKSQITRLDEYFDSAAVPGA